jgi:predicted dehydrogenase
LTLKAAVIGARRQRQGTGEFVAAALHRTGCEVRGVVGTTAATADAARATLEGYGITCRAYTSLDELLAAEPVDVVAVCSPAACHLPQIEVALAAGCHVFAEKPLWWEAGTSAEALSGRVEALTDGFLAAGRFLGLNTQWPFTLAAFDALHPGVRTPGVAPKEFDMSLGPIGAGPSMAVDSGSHLLSMLQVLAGPGSLHDVRATYQAAGVVEMILQCTYEHRAGRLKASLRLTQTPEPPRPAAYRIDGFSVHREVELAPYRVSFRADDQRVPVADPLQASVEAFVGAVKQGLNTDREAIVSGMTQLHELVSAAERVCQ